ncbi:MAG: DUF427 domain-containing protein [Cytophagaceae bacterium]
MKAIWNGKVLARSSKAEEIDGNYYFPIHSIKSKYFIPSERRSRCPYKGVAHYFHIVVDGKVNEDAAWYYPEPSVFAFTIKDRITFWKGVEIVESDEKVKFEIFNTLSFFF